MLVDGRLSTPATVPAVWLPATAPLARGVSTIGLTAPTALLDGEDWTPATTVPVLSPVLSPVLDPVEEPVLEPVDVPVE